MTIQTRGSILATILGFSALILILAGLMIGWKWIAPATEEEIVITTEVGEERDLITTIESIPNIESWSIGYEIWSSGTYDMMVDIGDEIIYFRCRESLADFFEDIDDLKTFQR